MPRRATTQPEPMLAPALMSVPGAPSLLAVSAPVELSVYQGDDKRWVFRLKQTGGAPFPLVGYTAAMQFRLAYADTDIPTSAVTPEVEVVDAPGGVITVTLPSESSALMTETQYLWDLEITETATSWTTTIVVGTLAVTKEVTRL